MICRYEFSPETLTPFRSSSYAIVWGFLFWSDSLIFIFSSRIILNDTFHKFDHINIHF